MITEESIVRGERASKARFFLGPYGQRASRKTEGQQKTRRTMEPRRPSLRGEPAAKRNESKDGRVELQCDALKI